MTCLRGSSGRSNLRCWSMGKVCSFMMSVMLSKDSSLNAIWERFVKVSIIMTESYWNNMSHPIPPHTRRYQTSSACCPRLTVLTALHSSSLGCKTHQRKEVHECTHRTAIQTVLSSPSREGRVLGVRWRLWSMPFNLSRGYTEQQEWVWSLSSTLGREGHDVGRMKGEGV